MQQVHNWQSMLSSSNNFTKINFYNSSICNRKTSCRTGYAALNDIQYCIYDQNEVLIRYFGIEIFEDATSMFDEKHLFE